MVDTVAAMMIIKHFRSGMKITDIVSSSAIRFISGFLSTSSFSKIGHHFRQRYARTLLEAEAEAEEKNR
jgi:hypothetical protein